jgi:predicted small secreted protein
MRGFILFIDNDDELDIKRLRMSNMKKLTFIIAISCFLLTACHTVHGVGEDIESGGEAIQHVSKR